MPIPVITVAQMREWERATWATGQTEAEVIRQVGQRVAERGMDLTRPGDLVVILAGKGNNGADARAALGGLADRRVEVLAVSDPATDTTRLETLVALRPALVIDGLFGIGLDRPLAGDWAQLVRKLNQARARVLAVDVPSGLDAQTGQPQGTAVEATITLTVGAVKVGLLEAAAWAFVGRLEVAEDVGLCRCPHAGELQWTSPRDFDGFPPARRVGSHKGNYGHLCILGGSIGFHGAAVLAARAAQRAQPGLITVYTPEGAYPVVASQLQAVMVAPWHENRAWPAGTTAILAGPGLAADSLPDSIKVQVRQVWSKAPVPVVIDASALDWLPHGAVPRDALRVVTPHPGEAARMLGVSPGEVQAHRLRSLRELSKRYGDAWVVLKGHQTLVGRSTGEVYVNGSGNPHLAQGGSGDVLSGYVAGLVAQPALREDVLTALRYAVWQHGTAADRLQTTRPGWVIEELVEALGEE